jgi:hypothetical protein
MWWKTFNNGVTINEGDDDEEVVNPNYGHDNKDEASSSRRKRRMWVRMVASMSLSA